MDLNLNESESRYYNDLFTLCDVEKSGKIQYLKATELIRSSGLDNPTVDQVKAETSTTKSATVRSGKCSQSTRHEMQNFFSRLGKVNIFSLLRSPVGWISHS